MKRFVVEIFVEYIIEKEQILGRIPAFVPLPSGNF